MIGFSAKFQLKWVFQTGDHRDIAAIEICVLFDREDFYIISQHVRQGTVSPTHYVIVADNSNLKIDHVQQITYRMTHMYYNWPGTVRVPAPCQVRGVIKKFSA